MGAKGGRPEFPKVRRQLRAAYNLDRLHALRLRLAFTSLSYIWLASQELKVAWSRATVQDQEGDRETLLPHKRKPSPHK